MIKSVIIASIASIIAAGVQAQDVVLRLHQFQPNTVGGIPQYAIDPWIARIEEQSNGRIKIEHYPSMQLGGAPPSLYDQARDGVADITWTLLGYTPGRFPKTEAFELPFLTLDAETSSRAFHEFVLENAMDEFADTHPIVFHTHGPGMFFSNTPITKIADLAGMKLRVPTRIIGYVIEELGGIPIGMPLPSVQEALSKHVIDGTALAYNGFKILDLGNLTDYSTYFDGDAGLYTATFVMTMNLDSYNSLPDDLRAIIDANATPEVSALFGRAMDENDDLGREISLTSDNETTFISAADTNEWKTAVEPVYERWINDMEELGFDGRALIQSARDHIALAKEM